MPINIRKYVNITSSVGGTSAVGFVELIGRIFSTNEFVPPGIILEFQTADAVGNYFGFATEEYERAKFYFSFVNKLGFAAKKISYARWVKTATAPLIIGGKITLSLASLKLITNGSFTLTIGTDTNLIGSLNFGSITSFADAATIIETAINAQTGTMWTAAGVVFNSLRGGFDFLGGDSTTSDAISVSPGTVGTDISTFMGWIPQSINGSAGAIWSNGAQVETITETLTNSVTLSNNFGSFLFTIGAALTDDEIVEAATWNVTQNNLFMFMVRASTLAKAATYGDETTGILVAENGTAVTFHPTSDEFAEQCPMMILAATDYNTQDCVQNFMFNQFNLTPSVTDIGTSNTLDSYLVNYYGVTQQAGSNLSFYQRGYLQGLASSPRDMNVYANEQWLKTYITSLIMNAFLSLPSFPTNDTGKSKLTAIIQTAVDLGLFNGTIRPGQIFNQDQINAITALSGDPQAYRQVEASGYWLTVNILQVINPNNNLLEYQGNYLLIYAKDNQIRSVTGRHVLI